MLFELRKPQPDGRVIEKLMKRFIYTAGITGVMQVVTLIIMTRLVELSDSGNPAVGSLVDRKLPPVTELGAASMIAIAGGVIYNASYLPKHAPLARRDRLPRVAAALVRRESLILSRIADFAWQRFSQVAGWSLLAYAVIGGMIEYAFVYDHTRGSQLVILTLMLALFVINVPILIGFTVARYARADER